MPRPPKHRSFERELPKIQRVGLAPKAEEQLSLDEQLPRRDHGWVQIEPTDYGYLPHCLCGIPLREMPSKGQAQNELRRHIMRTPQGRALVNTIRHVGRSANGS